MTLATILVVEDHPTTRKLVRVALGGAGFRVLEAGSGAAALALVGESPDLVLLDLHLPDMSGFQVAELLRQTELAADCPILAFSGFLPALEDGRIAAAGFAGFITKPVEPSRLLEIVRLHLPLAQATAEPGGGLRVLVAEDDAVQRKLLSTKLARLGYDVREAADGEAALELLLRVPVDVVISDVLMPRRDGFELSLAIRTTPSLAHIPVLLVSAHAQEVVDHRLAQVVGAHGLFLRQAGYEGIEAALDAAVRAGPSPCAPTSLEELRTDYLHRVIRQLERQGAFNAHLAQQCSLQAAQLDILAGTAEVLTRTLDADVLLGEMLDRTLEALGFTQGAAYLRQGDSHGDRHGDSFSLRAQRGFDALATSELDDLFGHAALLRKAAKGREPLFVTEAELSDDAISGGGGGGPSGDRGRPHSLIITPLVSGQEVLGVCVIGCSGPQVGSEWRPFALAIGAQVGQALAVVRALGQLATSEHRAQSILEALSEGVVLVGQDERVQSWNASAASLFGSDSVPMGAQTLRDLPARLRHEDGTYLAHEELATVRALSTGEPQVQTCALEPDGAERRVWLSVRAAPLVQAGETKPYAAVTSYTDITEHRRLEEQLRQSQKLEAMGRLAGGIAHDFNNLLMVVSSFSELALAGAPPGGELASDLEEIRRAADRATTLTRQLLVFSRSQAVDRRILDINTVVRGVERMLRRLIPTNIDFDLRLAAGPLTVRADAGQLEQVLVNLVVNAGDAMPDGGALTIGTTVVRVREHSLAEPGVAPGSYVQLTARDTGTGMSEEVRTRLFEPFFTTKSPDRGTGLGLATAYGIIQQSGGAITVESTPGAGTCFRVLLPAAAEAEEVGPDDEPAITPDMSPRTILVVEDGQPLRRAVALWLRQRGHTVLEAGTGHEALQAAAAHRGPIDLLLADIAIPGLGGIELANRLRSVRPELRLLFMSGHANHALPDGLPPTLAADCLAKPFTLGSLGQRVHEVLSLQAPAPPAPEVRHIG